MFKQIEFYSLKEALEFVAKHGGVIGEPSSRYDEIDYYPPYGAFAPAGAIVKLVDGSYFAIEAYTNGPLSEVTPDEDFGVKMFGWEKQNV